jgi:hypothetical protein
MCRECHYFFQRVCFKNHSCTAENSTPSKGKNYFIYYTFYQLFYTLLFDFEGLRTPTKRELKAPTQFYSRRYRELLQEFSPKKAAVECSDLKDLLKSSRFHRNGKLDLSYITPKQEKAVLEFMTGKSDQVVRENLKLILMKPKFFYFNLTTIHL